ncbi:hypothetical protein WDV93_14540 [Pantoea ananatis]
MFKESGLAGSNCRWSTAIIAGHWIGYGMLAGALVIMSGLWLTSYYQN